MPTLRASTSVKICVANCLPGAAGALLAAERTRTKQSEKNASPGTRGKDRTNVQEVSFSIFLALARHLRVMRSGLLGKMLSGATQRKENADEQGPRRSDG